MPRQVEINNLFFAYRNKPVLADVSFQLQPGSVNGLLGLNGQGKSTLLKIMAGVIRVPGFSLTGGKQNQEQLRTGYLAERPLYYPELTIEENIIFSARLNTCAVTTEKSDIKQAIERCQLKGYENQLASKLSKGYQQRLGLAMAIVSKPDLLLLDEPTDGLDPQQIHETQSLISEISADSIVLTSSHRLDEISQYCQQVFILHQKKIASEITLLDAPDRQNLAKNFEKITRPSVGDR